METLDVNVIIALLEKQRNEVESMLYRRILDLELHLIRANERIAEISVAAPNAGGNE